MPVKAARRAAPVVKGGKSHHHIAHEREEKHGGKAGPDHTSRARKAINLGQNIADDIAEREEKDACAIDKDTVRRRPKPLWPEGHRDIGRLGCTDDIGEQKDRHKGGHDEIIIFERHRRVACRLNAV